MAWEDTYLLSTILLVLLVSGCCTEDTELLQAVEGQTFLVNCRYDRSQHANMMKVWCQQTSTESCKVLASGLSTKAQGPKFFIWNHPDSHYFTVIMTASTVRDSGLYYCGIHDNRGTITVIKTIRLVVTRDSSDMSTSDIITTMRPTKVAILITTKYLRRDWTMTQSTAVVSSPDPGVTFSNVTNIPRVSISSIVLTVCGLFSKTLIFTVLFAVTWRSFGGQTMKPHNNGL